MLTDTEDRYRMYQKFSEEFFKLAKLKGANSGFMNKEQYKATIESVKIAKTARKKTSMQYRRLKRYDISTVDGVEKLISAPSSKKSKTIMYYVPNEEFFDIIHETHLAIGHGGRTRMIQEIHKKYKNITQEIVAIYLSLCISCQNKLKNMRKGLEMKNEVNGLCHVDLIDMQAYPDGPYKFILVYQEHVSKFVLLRSLKTNTAAEFVSTILEIFCTFGAPLILCNDIDCEFNNNLLEQFTDMWPGLKLVTNESHQSHLQADIEKCKEDVQKFLLDWMQDNNTNNWSLGINFIQLMKNSTYHEDIEKTPYKAMFGNDIKISLLDSKLQQEQVIDDNPEEELTNAEYLVE